MNSRYTMDPAVARARKRTLLGKIAGPAQQVGAVHEAAHGFAAAAVRAAWSASCCVVCDGPRQAHEIAVQLEGWSGGTEMFPAMEKITAVEALPDPEVGAERYDLLRRIAAGDPPRNLVVTADQLDEPVPHAEFFHAQRRELAAGRDTDPEELVRWLESSGYERVPQVFARGQFAVRGGILDVFSRHQQLPVRLEFFDRALESIREFDLDRQTSLQPVERCEVLPCRAEAQSVPLRDYFDERWKFIAIESETPENAHAFIRSARVGDEDGFNADIHAAGLAAFAPGDFVLDTARRAAFFKQLREWMDADWMVCLTCNNEGEWERFRELAVENGLDPGLLHYREGVFQHGFVYPAAKLACLSDAEIFGRAHATRPPPGARRERLMAGRDTSDFSDYEEDDLVVHPDHGIGRFLGTRRIPSADGAEQEVLAIAFANDARLFVPLEEAWRIARYVGVGKRRPPLSELGDTRWEKAKVRAQRSIFAYAKAMLALQAERENANGAVFPPDTPWQKEFEDAFVFRETQDQLRAIAETKADMESTRPMDRLICGDVGFGKTEVAVRAVFKAVMGGKQAVVLTPTTVLAQQHWQTFRERMSEYPVRVELLSRYRTRAEQTQVLKGLADGGVDVVIGTHRLLSGDVKIKNPGLVVVDEEQRFGVKHKDRFKERFRLVDVLTLSATPIPRTLYLALMGARDMSLIETPPPGRQPVETVICAYDERVIRDAINQELARGGQVYLLHNRVKTIEGLADKVRVLCPKAKVAVGHGQMEERELEEVMRNFVEGRTDVLVSTTIIESGLDIPNANTILIDRADRFGLADLYQLRGRVGRSGVKARAYLFLPRGLLVTGEAGKRISAIRQYSELGAGFRIAMRDLEIRGAGNILGTAQSGHIITVGFDLYCKLLRQAVAMLKGEARGRRRLAALRLDFVVTNEGEFHSGADATRAGAFLPSGYATEPAWRIDLYRRLNEAVAADELDRIATEMRDRFGPPPQTALNLVVQLKIRLAAAARNVTMVETRGDKLMLTRKGDFVLLGGKFPRLRAENPDQRIEEVLRLVESLLE